LATKSPTERISGPRQAQIVLEIKTGGRQVDMVVSAVDGAPEPKSSRHRRRPLLSQVRK